MKRSVVSVALLCLAAVGLILLESDVAFAGNENTPASIRVTRPLGTPLPVKEAVTPEELVPPTTAVVDEVKTVEDPLLGLDKSLLIEEPSLLGETPAPNTGGPDAFGYRWCDDNVAGCGPTFSWVDPEANGHTATNITFGSCDDGSGYLPAGGSFNYYGAVYAPTVTGASVNGFMSPGWLHSGYFSNNCTAIPGTAAPNRAIAPHWDDFHLGSGGATPACEGAGTAEIYGGTTGSNYYVTWNNIRIYPGTGPDDGDFQVVIVNAGSTATPNDLIFQYNDVDFTGTTQDNGISATVAMEGYSPSGVNVPTGLQYACNIASLHNGHAIRFFWTPPTPDFSVEALLVDPEEVVDQSTPLSISAVIRKSSAPGSHTIDRIDLTLDGVVIESMVPGPTLGPSGTAVVSFTPLNLPSLHAWHTACVVITDAEDDNPANNSSCTDKLLQTDNCALTKFFDAPITNAITFTSVASTDAAWAMKVDPGGPFGSIGEYWGAWLLGPGDPYWPWPDSDREPNSMRFAAWEDTDGDGLPNDPAIYVEAPMTPTMVYPHWEYAVPNVTGPAMPATSGDLWIGYFQDARIDGPAGSDGLAMGDPPCDPNRYALRPDGSWYIFEAYVGSFYCNDPNYGGDLGLKGCAKPSPGDPDLDLADFGGYVVGNVLTLEGFGGDNTASLTAAYIVAMNPENPDPGFDEWDGPGNCDMDDIAFTSSDLVRVQPSSKKEPDAIPASDVEFSPVTHLSKGEYAIVPVVVNNLPQGEAPWGGPWHWDQSLYRGTLTAEADCDVPPQYEGMIDPGFTSDYITLEVIVNHTHPGFAGVNNNFIATRVKEGIFLSWGNFGFGETGFNLYKRDDSGSFMKLNESPYKAMETYTDTDVVDGITYQYKLGLVMEDGNELTLGPLSMGKKALPTSYSLLGNRPNPMNGETEIRFAIPSDSRVSLKVYDVKGSLVKTIVDETIEAGYHSAIWNGMSESGQSVSNGIYFYRLTAGDFKESRKMVVLR